jgi:hypothetical protein
VGSGLGCREHAIGVLLADVGEARQEALRGGTFRRGQLARRRIDVGHERRMKLAEPLLHARRCS